MKLNPQKNPQKIALFGLNYAGKSKNDLIRLKSRIIGTEGKARKTIEKRTNTNISIYGKTVSIIGGRQGVQVAKRAVENLLRGSQHNKVYSWIERQIKK